MLHIPTGGTSLKSFKLKACRIKNKTSIMRLLIGVINISINICNDAVFGRNNFILIFMQRSVYNVVFVSCEIIFEKLDLSKRSIEG